MDFGPDITTYKNSRIGVYAGSFLPLTNGDIAAIERAAREVDVLFVVVEHDERQENALLQGTGFDAVTPRVRERWLSEVFRDQNRVRVTSWPAGDEHGLAEHLGHVDERVVASDFGAAMVRVGGLFASWDQLPEPVQRHYTKRVAICGWESSGKSYTAAYLAEQLGTSGVPEFGRHYYEQLGGYDAIASSQDALNTMAGQLGLLDAARGRKVLLLDTDLVYTQFYHLQDFGYAHPALDAIIRANAEQIDEWIFLEPHNPLDDDGSRFRLAQEQRQHTSNELLAMYRRYGASVHVVDEVDPEKRLARALELVEGWIA